MAGIYLFPFENIEFNSRVVIWGAGNVGTSFVKQIQRTEYCKIAAWVDSNYQLCKNRYHCVVSCSYVWENQNEYDAIIVAIDNEKIASEVVRILEQNNIEEEKIVLIKRRYLPFEDSTLDFWEILEGRQCVGELLREFNKSHIRSLDFFYDILNCYSEQEDEVKKKFIDEIKEYLLSEALEEEKFVLFRLFFRLNYFDEELMRELVEFTYEQKRLEWQYWLSVHIGLYEFLSPDSVYTNFYHEKRAIYNRLATRFMEGEVLKAASEKSNRIVILAQILHGEEESLSKFVSMYANEFAKVGKEVHIVITEPFLYYYGEAPITPSCATSKSSRAYLSQIATYVDERVKIHFALEDKIQKRYTNCVKEILEINPEIILEMTAKQGHLNPVLKQYFPVICVSTGNNCSANSFHKYVCRGKEKCLEMNLKYGSVLPNQIIDLPVGTIFPKAKYKYERKNYSLLPEDFVMVSVGRRLYSELTEDFIDAFIPLLSRYRHVKWLWVGQEAERLAEKYQSFIQDGQIVLWGFEKDLPSLYQICNVFLNPNRVGGGWSISWAIGEGLPVITTDYPNDSSPILGDMVISGDYSDLRATVEKMIGDRKYYEEWVEHTLTRKTECGFDKKVRSFLYSIEETVKEFSDGVIQ